MTLANSSLMGSSCRLTGTGTGPRGKHSRVGTQAAYQGKLCVQEKPRHRGPEEEEGPGSPRVPKTGGQAPEEAEARWRDAAPLPRHPHHAPGGPSAPHPRPALPHRKPTLEPRPGTSAIRHRASANGCRTSGIRQSTGALPTPEGRWERPGEPRDRLSAPTTLPRAPRRLGGVALSRIANGKAQWAGSEGVRQ